MPESRIIDSPRHRRKRSVPYGVLKIDSALRLKEGELIVAVYTSESALYKIKSFLAFVQDGLESGDAVNYVYPDEESLTVWAMLKDAGIDVEQYKRDDTLRLESLTEHFMSNGRLDYEKAVINGLNRWDAAKRKGYKHVRDIEDVGDFSFCGGQWLQYIKYYWLDPEWNDPSISKWAVSEEPTGVVYDPFVMEITAVNVENMTHTQLTELFSTMGRGAEVRTRIIGSRSV